MATLLNADDNGNELQLFLPKEVRAITNPTTINQDDGLGFLCGDIVDFYIGTDSANVYTLPANTPMGIPEAGMTISTATTLLLM